MRSVMLLLSFPLAELCSSEPTQLGIKETVVTCGSSVRESSSEREPLIKGSVQAVRQDAVPLQAKP